MPPSVPTCGYEETGPWVNEHLRDESSVVPRDDLELDPTLYLLVELPYLRNIP